LPHLIAIYGEETGRATLAPLLALIKGHAPRLARAAGGRGGLSERDSLLITYGDQVQGPGLPPLQVLAGFCRQHLNGIVSGIHILPFYPSTSDDGFSVQDYRAVDPALGDWADIAGLGRGFRLMFDAVINHISAGSEWFQAYLRGDPRYHDHFIAVLGSPDLSQVVRPRALPLLTRFATPEGEQAVWTTFSDDQVDLNYANPAVLLEIMDILLLYVERGAELIRLDAIAFLWKEIGTGCLHLPQTHHVIQLIRAVLDQAAPAVLLITETNVPHHDNLSYFGDGANEAQLVYNFALPPLVLHSLRTGHAAELSAWAASLRLPSNRVTFFNFLASHDGIGLNPARGLLAPDDIGALVEQTLAHGGLISYKHNPDGTRSPYELNINYFDALSDPASPEPSSVAVERFMTAQAIMLSLAGMPGIYFHSLFGSRGWPEGAALTGRSRTINRQKFLRADLESELADPGSLRAAVFRRYSGLLRARAASPAFNPYGGQQVLDGGPAVFALLRTAGDARVLCLQNVSDQPCTTSLDPKGIFGEANRVRDIITGQSVALSGPLTLEPYQTLWLTAD
jgi:sucrose phosphorylase